MYAFKSGSISSIGSSTVDSNVEESPLLFSKGGRIARASSLDRITEYFNRTKKRSPGSPPSPQTELSPVSPISPSPSPSIVSDTKVLKKRRRRVKFRNPVAEFVENTRKYTEEEECNSGLGPIPFKVEAWMWSCGTGCSLS